ncbi:MFS transporter [Streptomyces sp. SID8352]|uniref:MFS transporter n=1 Tax=Streptomyces sp. SID8352 TaxID=2690338 RepID=UPI00136B3116|nr:MFS transporter [Streptomyces sp. SID8352]MYU24801.1 MFS transporter [Streptomyces sp. SID8352]
MPTLTMAAEAERIRSSVTLTDVRRATVICFLAWTFAVYDFILFANLLPVISGDLDWDSAKATGVNTWVTAGTALVAFLVGPFVDRFGRRAGIIGCVVGAAVASLLTWLGGYAAGAIGLAGIVLLIVIRSLAGVGYSEQAVNATYLNEMYAHVYTDEKSMRRRGLLYAFVQGGWPIGAVIAAISIQILEPIGGWELCFVVAVFPALLIPLAARRLKESPVFEAKRRIEELRAQGRTADAAELAHLTGQKESAPQAGVRALFQGESRRATLTLSIAFLLNWVGILAFAFQGTLILVNGKEISFTSALQVLIVSNLAGFLGYLFHGWLGDRISRRTTISFGWFVSSLCFAVMVLGPNGNFGLLVAAYAVGTFFLIGPYSAMLFFNSESFPVETRGTASTFINALGQVGAIIGGALFTATLSAAGSSAAEQADAWIRAGLIWGCVPILLSAVAILFARNVKPLSGMSAHSPSSAPSASTA